jgi:hypothetical protein
VSAFVVGLTFACLLSGGLVLDGGRIVAARLDVADAAGNAARAGAQQVVGLRAGEPKLDPVRARRAAQDVLSAEGVMGTVTVDGRSVTVTARTTASMLLIRLVGIEGRTVEATTTARLEDGR